MASTEYRGTPDGFDSAWREPTPAEMPPGYPAMVEALHVEELDPDHVWGHITFGRFFVGGNGAAHGGAIALIFDEMMGRLANTERRPSRTAYLHVNYRSVTPLGRVLHAEARLDRLDGRKRFLSASLRDGELICADADGLFVELRSGQA